jgi:hypothetical protein
MKVLSDLLSNNHRLEDTVHFFGGGGRGVTCLELGHFKELHIPPKKFMSSK